MKKGYILLALTILILVLSGCKAEETAEVLPTHLVIIVENCAARPAPDLSEAEQLLAEVIESEGTILVISADGDPSIVFEEDFALDDRFRKSSKEYLQNQISAKVAQVTERISAVSARTAEIDLYETLRIASDYVNYKSREEGNIRLLIYSSGVSTAGSLLLEDIDDNIIERLQTEKLMLDFSAAEITFYGLGETLPPQEPFSAAEKESLKNFWSKYLNISEADFINSPVTEERKSADRTNLPPVSAVSFRASKSFEPFSIEFLPDTAVPVDKQEAAEKAEMLAGVMQENETLTILIAGGVAGDTFGQNSEKLGKERAEYIRNLVLDYDGGLESRILTISVSAGAYNHIYGAPLDSESSKHNRSAAVLDARSKEAAALTTGQN